MLFSPKIANYLAKKRNLPILQRKIK